MRSMRPALAPELHEQQRTEDIVVQSQLKENKRKRCEVARTRAAAAKFDNDSTDEPSPRFKAREGNCLRWDRATGQLKAYQSVSKARKETATVSSSRVTQADKVIEPVAGVQVDQVKRESTICN